MKTKQNDSNKKTLPKLFITKTNQRPSRKMQCFQIRISREISTKKVTSGLVPIFQPEKLNFLLANVIKYNNEFLF